MADTLATYYRASLEDYNRAHGLSDQSQPEFILKEEGNVD